MKTEDKFYYIGEASRMLEVPAHIIRFWEKEFSDISPLRDQRGHRIYRKGDIEKLHRIKLLVYSDGYKIKGAKKRMRDKAPAGTEKHVEKIFRDILKDIQEIKKCLQ
ncbi:MAG: MerR family transcriptional regulator [Candidatus Omnitrophica bacterium]|nr:MerR family transcriptional regulator [Candidatus Omnitrophota bacterium]